MTLIHLICVTLDNNSKKFICYVKSSHVVFSRNNFSSSFSHHVSQLFLFLFTLLCLYSLMCNRTSQVFNFFNPCLQRKFSICFSFIPQKLHCVTQFFSVYVLKLSSEMEENCYYDINMHTHTHDIFTKKELSKSFFRHAKEEKKIYLITFERWQKKKKNYVRKWNNFLCVAFNIAISSSSFSINHPPSRYNS